jgi:hypothetical protein
MPCDSGELLASNSHLIQQRLQIWISANKYVYLICSLL